MRRSNDRPSPLSPRGCIALLLAWGSLGTLVPIGLAEAQEPPYDQPPSAEPPYYRVRYEAASTPGGLAFPVQYTVWIPPGEGPLSGVVVHQHGCGEGSCLSGQTGAYDLHWQALAKKHRCALLSPSYEQPQDADCQKWCDPRNGSGETFITALAELGALSGHLELAEVPWALWGHSGGGHWAGGMLLLHPERVAAVWLRSGVPLLAPNPERPEIRAHEVPEAALGVPLMANPGTREGVTVKEGRFAGVWPANLAFFEAMRSQGALAGVAVDPLSSHECGNQRYLAIPWFDACLSARLPERAGDPLRALAEEEGWLAPLHAGETEIVAPVPADDFEGPRDRSVWLPGADIAAAWVHYVRDTEVPDETPPPAPSHLVVEDATLTWEAEADLESGLAHFLIERDGEIVATVTGAAPNRFGRPVFQGLQYSDTPAAPLAEMRYLDPSAEAGKEHRYRVISVNTVGLESP